MSREVNKTFSYQFCPDQHDDVYISHWTRFGHVVLSVYIVVFKNGNHRSQCNCYRSPHITPGYVSS